MREKLVKLLKFVNFHCQVLKTSKCHHTMLGVKFRTRWCWGCTTIISHECRVYTGSLGWWYRVLSTVPTTTHGYILTYYYLRSTNVKLCKPCKNDISRSETYMSVLLGVWLMIVRTRTLLYVVSSKFI